MFTIYKVELGHKLHIQKNTAGIYDWFQLHLLVLDIMVMGTCKVQVFLFLSIVKYCRHLESATDKLHGEHWLNIFIKIRTFLLGHVKFGLSDSIVVQEARFRADRYRKYPKSIV